MNEAKRPVASKLKDENLQRILCWTAFLACICSDEHESTVAPPLDAHITQTEPETSADGANYGLGPPGAESSPRSNSRHGVERAKSDRTVPGGMFNAMEMQGVPVYKAFYEACFFGNDGPV